jgi:hypothetical protein
MEETERSLFRTEVQMQMASMVAADDFNWSKSELEKNPANPTDDLLKRRATYMWKCDEIKEIGKTFGMSFEKEANGDVRIVCGEDDADLEEVDEA